MAEVDRKPRDLDLFVAAAIGGVIGALARHGVDLVFPPETEERPLATSVIHLTGAASLGIVLEAAITFAPDPAANSFARRLRPFLITGVLGGYTTFSTYMVEAHGLVTSDRAPLALLYVFGSLVAGVICVVLGMRLGRALFHRDDEPAELVAREDSDIRLLEDEA